MVARVHVDGVSRVYDDGSHNAFTDLCRFRDHLYLTFRSCPDGHMLFTSSRIRVLRSPDGHSWQEVFSFSVPGRDVRDPHLLVFRNRLFVYSGTWLVEPGDPRHLDMNEHQGYCSWSDDGREWHGPTALDGTHGYYVWRAGAFGDRAYLNGRRVKDFRKVDTRAEEEPLWESWLMESPDGFSFRPLGLIQPAYGDETAFAFRLDGSVLAVARSAGGRPAQLCRSTPPYTDWTRKDLDRSVGGPLLAAWGDRYLVGGRKSIEPRRPVTAIYWLVDDSLQEITELPSGGDTSYPGFVALSHSRGLLSYYSSHEGSGAGVAPCHIYLAELSLS